jgi:hypothetical protein
LTYVNAVQISLTQADIITLYFDREIGKMSFKAKDDLAEINRKSEKNVGILNAKISQLGKKAAVAKMTLTKNLNCFKNSLQQYKKKRTIGQI